MSAIFRRPVIGGLALIALLVFASPDGGARPTAAAVDLLPNLKALPAHELLVQSSGGITNLRFAITSWNAGAGPLELRAGEIDTGVKKQKVYQRIYADDGSYREVLAGSFVWHAAHQHVHFEDYALYTLQPVGAPGGSSRASSKTTFCIAETDHVDPSLPGSPANPVYTTCNNDVQGLSIGWGDTYPYYLAGQEIDITGLSPGDYFLTLNVDPQDRLEENDETDNSSTVLVRLDPAAETAVVLPDADTDGVTDAEDNCPNWNNPTQTLPPWPVAADDPDCDGFSTADETYFETEPDLQCGADAWPPDHFDDGIINTTDVLWLRNHFQQSVPPAPPVADIWIDGIVNTTDVLQHRPFFGQSCSP